MIYVNPEPNTSFFLCIRHFNILRMIILFPALQKTLNSFLKAFLAIYKIFLGFTLFTILIINFSRFYSSFAFLLLFWTISLLWAGRKSL